MEVFSGFLQCCIILIHFILLANSQNCIINKDCTRPDCLCATTQHELGSKNIPQIVYFALDDEISNRVSEYYQRLFHPSRKNPNGCPIAATLMTSYQGTNYRKLQEFYDQGFEIGLHATTDPKSKSELIGEIKRQRENIINNTDVPLKSLVGWRSPFLKTLGNDQMNALRELGMKYDISLTFIRRPWTAPDPFPFTADFPWPYVCNIPPCWNKSISDVWEVPINAMWDYKNQFPCVYTDGCHNAPPTEDDFVDYMMSNFNNSYYGNRAPFGIHLHARFLSQVKYYRGMDRFIHDILSMSTNSMDIYIVPVIKMLDWLSYPVALSDIINFESWKCPPGRDYLPIPPLPPPETTPEPTTTTEAPPLLDPTDCRQNDTCNLPSCFCKTIEHFLPKEKIPQIVYFAIDDAIDRNVINYYQNLFRRSRRNPNGCPITVSFYVVDTGNNYTIVQELYKRGMEIASHGLTQEQIKTKKSLLKAAKEQKENIANNAYIPIEEIVGWRSPQLQTLGDEQADVLQSLNYTYDISYTYTRRPNSSSNVWPMTVDYGWYNLPCNIPPCLKRAHNGFWEVPINSMWHYSRGSICTYTDSCARPPPTQQHVFKYLVDNFENSYNRNQQNKAPFGIHLHGRWFHDSKNLEGMDRFIQYLLMKDDVYIVSVKQMLEWMKQPTALNDIKSFVPWLCGTDSRVKH